MQSCGRGPRLICRGWHGLALLVMPLTGQVPPNLAGPNGLWDGLPEPPDTGARSSAQRSQPPHEFLAQAVRSPRSYNHTRRACRGYVKVMEVMWRPPKPAGSWLGVARRPTSGRAASGRAGNPRRCRAGGPVAVKHQARQRRVIAQRLSHPVGTAGAELVLEMPWREQIARHRDWHARLLA